MKKFGCAQFTVVFFLICVVIFGGLFFIINSLLDGMFKDQVLAELPKYKDCVEFETNDETDYLTFRKYIFDDKVNALIPKSSYLKKVTEADFEEIGLHLDHYENWVKEKGYDGYDFSRDAINQGDSFYLKNKETFEAYESLPEKFSAYTIYYFDAETKTLYYMGYNI